MSVNLKVTLGTVNYTNYLHVTASKVSSPASIAWETWIDVPVTNYNFVIPNLDPATYYIRYYDAATDTALGTLVAELIVNALTSEFVSERRFYTVGRGGTYDPADGDVMIVDPYLVNKNVTGLFKEGFRYYEQGTEYTHDSTAGNIEIINGTYLSAGEKVSVEIKYEVAGNSQAVTVSGGLYTGFLNITEPTKSLLSGDVNKRIRCVGSTATQVITLPALSAISIDNGYYFDNSCGGTAAQVKLLTNGLDRVRFNGFMSASNEFSEFWVSKGEHLLLRKFDDTYWEVITDYKGTNVGEKITAGFKGHPNTLTENGQLVDGDEYPRLWWWINNVLPSTHKYVTNTVTGSFTPDSAKPGQFAIHSSLKKFRMPSTVGLSEKGLANFETYGGDTANRPVDAPGGFQGEMIGPHTHGKVPLRFNDTDRGGGSSLFSVDTEGSTGLNDGTENRVKNIGVIYCRRI